VRADDPSDVVREMFARYPAADFDGPAALIHPDAVWNTHVAPVETVAAWHEADTAGDRAG